MKPFDLGTVIQVVEAIENIGIDKGIADDGSDANVFAAHGDVLVDRIPKVFNGHHLFGTFHLGIRTKGTFGVAGIRAFDVESPRQMTLFGEVFLNLLPSNAEVIFGGNGIQSASPEAFKGGNYPSLEGVKPPMPSTFEGGLNRGFESIGQGLWEVGHGEEIIWVAMRPF